MEKPRPCFSEWWPWSRTAGAGTTLPSFILYPDVQFSKCIRPDSRSLSTSQRWLPTKTCQMSAWCLMLYFASDGNMELDSLMWVLLLLGSEKGYWLSLKIPALEPGHQGHVSPHGRPSLEKLHIRFCQRKFSWTFCVIPSQDQASMVLRGRESEGDRIIHVSGKHLLFASPRSLDQGINLQPRYVSWLGTEPATFFRCMGPTPWATPARAKNKKNFLKCWLCQHISTLT